MARNIRILVVWTVALAFFSAAVAQLATPPGTLGDEPEIGLFILAASPDEEQARQALDSIAASWRDGYAAMFVDMARFFRAPSGSRGSGFLADVAETEQGGFDSGASSRAVRPRDPGSLIRERLVRFLEKQTGQRFGHDLDGWRRWIWSRPYEPHADYAAFKGGVLGNVDSRMRGFFPPGVTAEIRLDQIDWGGVKVGGIPALDHPPVVPASEAGWLKPRHVVFGIVVDGQARAYPKRILAWHELARDRLGQVELTLVYCTLCGAVIPYDSRVGERTFTLVTSGLLYRSNKLMFDRETGSLWSSLYGKPVVGPLVEVRIRLERLPVVTTTWGEWRAAHPQTTVLSLRRAQVCVRPAVRSRAPPGRPLPQPDSGMQYSSASVHSSGSASMRQAPSTQRPTAQLAATTQSLSAEHDLRQLDAPHA